MISQQKFPKDFLWGASTSAHQVEGGAHNQWSVWELANAADLAAGAEKRLGWLPDWPELKGEATNPDNYVAGKGVDHYNRYEEDFDLLGKLQFNSFRFGLEWSRINPEEGVWDKEAIAHYHRYIDAMLQRGITPVMNIWHTTIPVWFAERGGFDKRENLELFDRYIAKVAEEYADKVEYVITMNEPNVYTTFGYMTGEWPPQHKSFRQSYRVYRHLVQAHRRAYTILKQRRSTLKVGIAMQLGNIQAKRPHNVLDGVATKLMRWSWNWWFLSRIKNYQDFVGINYYFTDYYKGLSFKRAENSAAQGNDIDLPVVRRFNPSVPLNDLGWYMEPEGLYPVILRAWARYKKPIIITENGVADRNDQYRQWWVEQTVIAMQRALSEGVEIHGYMHWSLLDNFEWAYGWWPKFGLVEVDRSTMKRTPRLSAIWFARYLRSLQGLEAAPKPASPAAATTAPAPAAAALLTAEDIEEVDVQPATAPPAKPAASQAKPASRRPMLRRSSSQPKPAPAASPTGSTRSSVLGRLKPVRGRFSKTDPNDPNRPRRRRTL